MKKAFTLIELIAVIAVIGIIAVITTPILTTTINDSKESLNQTQIKAIESAARNYGVENITLINNAPSESYITLKTLKDKGYLDDKEVKNIINKQTAGGKVCVTWSNNQFVYKYKEQGAC